MTLPIVTLTPNDSGLKIGDAVPLIEPNVHDSCILADRDGTQVGLFLTELPADLLNLVNIADAELRTKRVPKSDMRRSSGLMPAKAAYAPSLPITLFCSRHRQR